MTRLKDKIAVVTGSASGLGKSIAFEFARQGAIVAVVDRDPDMGARTVNDILDMDGQAIAISADVAKLEEVKRIFTEIISSFGRLDILVNNAGVAGRSLGDGPVDRCNEEAWDLIMDVNLRGTFLCCKYGLPVMMEQKSGAIINMSSVLGMVGCQDYFTSHAYQTSKSGIIGLTRSISAYYAKHGIRANAIAPGLMDSKATEKVQQNEPVMAFVQRMQPLGGLGNPEDVAMAAVYLASDESGFVTGQVLAVDGGWSVQ